MKKAITPNKEQIKQKRLKLGLTQTNAGEVLYTSLRGWQHWEHGDRTMHPAMWELFLIKTKT